LYFADSKRLLTFMRSLAQARQTATLIFLLFPLLKLLSLTQVPMDRKDIAMRKFGRRLAFLRRQKGFSQRELAAAAGLEYRQVVAIEAGKVNLLFTTILALAKGLEVTPDQLLESP
jgi:DNA-binding XRE family transcriptional regulator